MSVVIVDYGMGNLFSIKRMLDSLLVPNTISRKPDDILSAEKIILPGVGSFKIAMENLQRYQLIAPLNEAVRDNKIPFMGICLGMQLLAKHSKEGGTTNGLGWIDGVVERLNNIKNYRIPHVGWNNINIIKADSLFKSFLENPTFYFTHSYILKLTHEKPVVATCDYGTTFPVTVRVDNIFGTQFHPEKSQLNGKILMENFLNWRA